MQATDHEHLRRDDYAASLHQGLKAARLRAQLAFTTISQSEIDSEAVIVDVGCGIGLLLRSLEQAGYRRLFGIDSSKVAIAHLQHNSSSVNLCRLDIDTLPLPFDSATADVVVCMEVFEHTYDPVRALDELARVLRPGGLAISSFPNEYRVRQRLRFALGRSISSPLKVGGHIKLFNKALAIQFMSLRLQVEQVKAIPEARVPKLAVSWAPTLFAKWFYVTATKVHSG
jgi:2-polyprenyl-3-methyl-5-hydroxy-6-metoxy-1,4-benzoquinol methylase